MSNKHNNTTRVTVNGFPLPSFQYEFLDLLHDVLDEQDADVLRQLQMLANEIRDLKGVKIEDILDVIDEAAALRLTNREPV